MSQTFYVFKLNTLGKLMCSLQRPEMENFLFNLVLFRSYVWPQTFKCLFRQWCQIVNQHKFHSVAVLKHVEDMQLTGRLTVDLPSFRLWGRQKKTKGWILHSSWPRLLCMTAALPTAVQCMWCLSEFIKLLVDHEACSGWWKAPIPLRTVASSLSLIHSFR